MNLLTVLSAISAGEIGIVSFFTSKAISIKNKEIKTYFNDIDFNIEVAPNLENFSDITPNLENFPNIEKIDF